MSEIRMTSRYIAQMWADMRRAQCWERGEPLPDWLVEWDAKMAKEGDALIQAALKP